MAHKNLIPEWVQENVKENINLLIKNKFKMMLPP